jgi:hypothetical protein
MIPFLMGLLIILLLREFIGWQILNLWQNPFAFAPTILSVLVIYLINFLHVRRFSVNSILIDLLDSRLMSGGSCSQSGMDLLKKMIQAGVDVNARGRNHRPGKTPLMMVIGNYNCPQYAKMLIDAGANVNALSLSGSSALFTGNSSLFLRLRENEITFEEMQLLIQSGADTNILNYKYTNGLDGSFQMKDLPLYRAFLKGELFLNNQYTLTYPI